jgi:hypothetical protein
VDGDGHHGARAAAEFAENSRSCGRGAARDEKPLVGRLLDRLLVFPGARRDVLLMRSTICSSPTDDSWAPEREVAPVSRRRRPGDEFDLGPPKSWSHQDVADVVELEDVAPSPLRVGQSTTFSSDW